MCKHKPGTLLRVKPGLIDDFVNNYPELRQAYYSIFELISCKNAYHSQDCVLEVYDHNLNNYKNWYSKRFKVIWEPEE